MLIPVYQRKKDNGTHCFQLPHLSHVAVRMQVHCGLKDLVCPSLCIHTPANQAFKLIGSLQDLSPIRRLSSSQSVLQARQSSEVKHTLPQCCSNWIWIGDYCYCRFPHGNTLINQRLKAEMLKLSWRQSHSFSRTEHIWLARITAEETLDPFNQTFSLLYLENMPPDRQVTDVGDFSHLFGDT